MCHLRLFYFCFLFVVAAVLANKDVYIIIQWHTATNYLKTALCTTLLRLRFSFRSRKRDGNSETDGVTLSQSLHAIQ